MPPTERLTREQKEKAVSIGSNPPVRGIAPPSDSDWLHRESLMDTAGLTLSQLLLVDYDERLFWGEHDSGSRESESRDSKGNSADARTDGPDFYPARVEGTESTPGSVQKLMRDCRARGVTFLIPTYEERSWSLPVGYQCMYKSYFQPDTRLWFPIPRLITLYVFRRDLALSQFVNGSYRIVVALKVLATEIDISMNVRAFKELTCLKLRPHVDHPKVLEYPDSFFDNVRAVAALSHQRWPDISEERIRRQLARISRDSGKKRLQLFSKKEKAHLRRSKKMKMLPDLSALLGGDLGLLRSNLMYILDDMDLGGSDLGESGSRGLLPDPHAPVYVDPVEEDKHLEMEAAGPKSQGKKRSRDEGDVPDTGRDSTPEGPGDAHTEERPKKKKKKRKSAEKAQGGSASREKPITHSEKGVNRAVVPDRDVSFEKQLLRKKRKDPADGERGRRPRKETMGFKWSLLLARRTPSLARCLLPASLRRGREAEIFLSLQNHGLRSRTAWSSSMWRTPCSSVIMFSRRSSLSGEERTQSFPGR
ncbi:hypothetical protein N665_0621s0010 [Sinapis alba]|nr:hypothetical protein N665_0621s0010 [Sinapis alba]